MSSLTNKKILKFWYPLASTWLMMSLEGPFIAAIIARLPEPKFNLAAYGVAFSFALIIESPIIMIMSASTALVKDRNSFLKLRNFTYLLNLVITLLMLIVLIPPVFDYIAIDLITLPLHIAHLTHIAVAILLPWPASIGYRRFYQGILIRNNLTRRVAFGTIFRLVTMAVTALILYFSTNADGVVVGATAMSVGVTSEALVIKLMTLSTLKNLRMVSDKNENSLDYRGLVNFYYPLALTSMLTLGVQPMVSFFLAQSKMPIESLAVLPVITSLVFIFRSVGLSFQEVAIALMGKNGENYRQLKNFAQMLGIIATCLLAIVAFTPLSQIWFHNVSGLSLELSSFAKIPLMIIAVMPGLSVLITFQRSVLVYSRKTSPITFATIIEVVGILLILFITIKHLEFVGVIAAATAFLVGRTGSITYLMFPFLKTSRSFEKN